MAPIIFDKININTLEVNSTVSVGENHADHWSGHLKRNFGMGIITGKNYITNSENLIIDNDKSDFLLNNPKRQHTNQNE